MNRFRFSRKQLCIPYALFLICFVVLPLAVIVYYAFTDGSGRFTLANFLNFFTNGNTIGTLCYSAVIAVAVTAVCLLVAYPVAYVLARSGLKRGPVLLMLFILPMWDQLYAEDHSAQGDTDSDRGKSLPASVS